MRSRKQALVAVTGIAVLYIAGIGFGIWMISSTNRRMDSLRPIPGGVVTTGTIARADEHCSKSCWWDPHIQWFDAVGSAHEFTSISYSNRPPIGTSVRVSYDPSDPAVAHEVSRDPRILDPPLYTGYGIAITAGLLMIIVIPMFLVEMRKLPWTAPPLAERSGLPAPPEAAAHANLERDIGVATTGLLGAGIVVSTLGALIGLGNGAPWIVILWLSGIVAMLWSRHAVLVHCHDPATETESLRQWWRTRGAPMMLLSTSIGMTATVVVVALIA